MEFKTIKCRIYPDPEQRETINQWLGATRYVYNRILFAFKHEDNVDLDQLRVRFVNNENYIDRDSWMLDIPYSIRVNAYRDLVKNIVSNVARLENPHNANRIKKRVANNASLIERQYGFSLKYRRRYNGSVYINKEDWNRQRGKFANIFTSDMQSEDDLPLNIQHDSRLIRKNNKYYFCFPTSD
jgi:transposase